MQRIELLMILMVLLLAPAGAAFADPDIGCGPGTQIWEGNTGTLPKVLGATTNGTFGLQTFGITFGTLGCNQGGTVTADARLQHFTAGNLDRLAEEMSRGEGETLETFALLIGIEDSHRLAFYQFTQAHFAEIFASDQLTDGEALASLTALMARDDTFGVYVGS